MTHVHDGPTDVAIADEVIRLGQLLKLAGLAEDGGHAKALLENGEVSVDGTREHRRGRKVHPGAVVTVGGRGIRVVRG